MEVESTAIVCDMGTLNTKIGFAGDEKPRIIYPTVVGTPMLSGKWDIKTPLYYKHILSFHQFYLIFRVSFDWRLERILHWK